MRCSEIRKISGIYKIRNFIDEKKRGDVFLKKPLVSFEASKNCKSLKSFFPDEEEEENE